MKILTPLDNDFQSKMDELVFASFAHPIYHSNHITYYRSTQNLDYLQDYSAIVLDNNETPSVGIIVASYRDQELNKLFLSYFDNPAAFLISEVQSTELVNEALVLLNGHFKSNRFAEVLSKSDFSVRVYDGQGKQKNSEFLELLLKSANKVDVEFERIINLDLSKNRIRKDFSKSVISAVKQYDKTTTKTQIVCWTDDENLISDSISNLQTLHLASAGRLTRSSESWAIQKQQVQDGSMILVNGFVNNKNVHGSLFLLSNKIAYYGVSANIFQPGRSVSHAFLVRAIFFLKEIGIERLYLGNQYENLRGVSDIKILNISKFKSFFGGFVKPNLVIINET
jgi:hypothetical protein